MMATRWGIASAGKISSDFVTAMKAQKDDHRVVAVGARSLADAQAFAKKYGAEKSYGSYEELSKDPDVGQFYVEILVIGFLVTENLSLFFTGLFFSFYVI